ncbi:MAG: recombinase family protein [Lentilitoribacter sp.]
MKKIRCAIYTRKSSEEGLDQDFNSLDAQREACTAYIASQKHEGWILLPEYYDDGGISGGTMDRPALQRLLNDIDEGLVDQIVVYKIDRLTRSLADFAKLVDHLDAAEASFVSVTQSFNTSTSMGRLTLNVLLSFAQFEREVTAERIRDKISASKKKGLWMGGSVPIGYEICGRSLKLNEKEAETIRTIYDLYRKHGNIRLVKYKMDKLGLRSKCRTITVKPSVGEKHQKQIGDVPFSKGHIHFILTNPIYAGRIRHKDTVYDGQHPHIINPQIWDEVQIQLQADARKNRTQKTGAVDQSKLLGKIYDGNGERFTPSHSKKGKRRYRYYVSRHLIRDSVNNPSSDQTKSLSETNSKTNWRLPAKQFEDMIGKAIMDHLNKNQHKLLTKDASAEQIKSCSKTIKSLTCENDKPPQLKLNHFKLIKRIDLQAGSITITLSGEETATQLSIDPELINEDILIFDTPFQHRKRGVESKFTIGNQITNHDEILVKNLAQAHHFMEQLKLGKSPDQIAQDYSVKSNTMISARRVLHLIKLACLAPDITDTILKGRQPYGLTSARLLKSPLPSDWKEQREMVRKLV